MHELLESMAAGVQVFSTEKEHSYDLLKSWPT